MNFKKYTILILTGLFLKSSYIFAQGAPNGGFGGQNVDSDRTITTAVPFVSISPDARSSGMGDVGVAISPDANSSYWNPAKLAFANHQFGASLSYSPWLRNLINDMSLSYLTAYYKIDDRQAVDFSLRYFDLGDIQLTDEVGEIIQDFTPREFAVGGHYSLKLTENFSMAIGGRFIHSNVAGNSVIGGVGQQAKPGTTGAADIAGYYTMPGMNIGGLETDLAFGFNISNIGAKISYSTKDERDFIPTNLRLGGAATVGIDAYNKVTLALDVNKLLVPTPPERDENGNITKGEDPRDITLLSGIFKSFGDAPGGFSEELKEFTVSFGAEYAYDDLFFARTGFFAEHDEKGGRKYATVGLGARYQKFGLDIAYLIPVKKNNPLAETLRFTLMLNLGEE